MRTFETIWWENKFSKDYLPEFPKVDQFTNHLFEAYRKLEFEWLDTLFDKIYQLIAKKPIKVFKLFSDNTTKDIEFIRREFFNHNILIMFSKKETSIGANSILDLGYHIPTKKIHIFVSGPSFFQTFKKGNEADLRLLLLEFKDSIAHEDTHVQQHETRKVKAKYNHPKDPDILSPENDAYYNQKDELVAYASGEAAKLKGKVNKKQFTQLLSSSEGIQNLIDIIEKDEDAGTWQLSRLKRYYDNRKKYPQVWKEYIKKLYWFLS